MDSFEAVVATLLERHGYWTRTSVKVELTRDEKREIGRPSSPRWELDVVAYSGASNELLVVECKSYLDSPGVAAEAFDEENFEKSSRYKLFVDETLRRVVLDRLVGQLVDAGFCPPDVRVRLCLAAGKFNGNPQPLKERFEREGWTLFGPDWLHEQLSDLASSGYENSIASVVVKLLLRHKPAHRPMAPDVPKAEPPVREYEHIPEDMRRAVLVAAYYLSRYQHDRLGLGNQDRTFEAVAARLHVKKHTLKNYRDRFDPHTDSGRRGWHQAPLTSELQALLNELRGVPEERLRAEVLQSFRDGIA